MPSSPIKSPNAYEKVVDRLLQSPRYGEHMARFWLDAARYGDTHGLHLDNYREMWPYRDWVIKAFNDNKPYDHFLTEQLAGDLLPNATLDQIVATGFNRCHVTTSEGGSIEEEVYVRNVVDRVETTGTVFLGLTVGCCRCHDHKFDPIKKKEFYQLFAFFNNLDGPALDGNAALPAPIVRIPTAEQAAELDRLQQEIAVVRKTDRGGSGEGEVRRQRRRQGAGTSGRGRNTCGSTTPSRPGAKPSSDGGVNGQWNFVASAETPGFQRRKVVDAHGDRTEPALLRERQSRPARRRRRHAVRLRLSRSGQSAEGNHASVAHRRMAASGLLGRERHRLGQRQLRPSAGTSARCRRRANGCVWKWTRRKVGLKPGTVINGWAFTQFDGTVYWDKAGIVTQTPQGNQPLRRSDGLGSRADAPAAARDCRSTFSRLVKLPRAKRNEQQKKQLRDYFLENAYAKTPATFAPLRNRSPNLEKKREQIEKDMPATLVFKERATPKPAYILKRGEYDQRGEQVGRETPKFLPPLPEKAPPRSSRPGAMAAGAGPSADGPRRGQSFVAAVLRHRTRQDDGGFRHAGRIAEPSATCSTGWPCSSARTAGTSRR